MAKRIRPVVVHNHNSSFNEDVPARVYTAMHLVEHFTAKTEYKPLPMKKGYEDAVTEWDSLPRIELTPKETSTYNSALELLEKYFDGEMRESYLEAQHYVREEELRKRARIDGGPIIVMECPQCGGTERKHRCLLCRTKGVVTVGMVP